MYILNVNLYLFSACYNDVRFDYYWFPLRNEEVEQSITASEMRIQSAELNCDRGDLMYVNYTSNTTFRALICLVIYKKNHSKCLLILCKKV